MKDDQRNYDERRVEECGGIMPNKQENHADPSQESVFASSEYIVIPMNTEEYEILKTNLARIGHTPESAIEFLLNYTITHGEKMIARKEQGEDPKIIVEKFVGECYEAMCRKYWDEQLKKQLEVLESIQKKLFAASMLRRKPKEIYEYLETPGHVAVLTVRGVPKNTMMSCDTYMMMTQFATDEKTLREREECRRLMEGEA